MGRGPIVIRQMVRRRRAHDGEESGSGDDGFECCGFCRVCTCLRWGFLATPTGVVKAIEMVMATINEIQLSSPFLGGKFYSSSTDFDLFSQTRSNLNSKWFFICLRFTSRMVNG